MVKAITLLLAGGAAVGGLYLIQRAQEAREGQATPQDPGYYDPLFAGGGGMQPYDPYAGYGDYFDPFADGAGGLGYDPYMDPYGPYGPDAAPGAEPQPYIDQGTYNVTIPMDEETSAAVLQIQREQAAAAKREGRIQTGLIAAGTAPFVAKPLFKGARAIGRGATAATRATTQAVTGAAQGFQRTAGLAGGRGAQGIARGFKASPATLAKAGRIGARAGRLAGPAGIVIGAGFSAAEEAREFKETRQRYGTGGGALVATSDVVVKTATLGFVDTEDIAQGVRSTGRAVGRGARGAWRRAKSIF